MNNTEKLKLFRELFEQAFYTRNLKFNTNKFEEIYCDMEMLRNSLAGPFYNIYI